MFGPVITRDLDRGTRFALRTEADMTHVNDVPVNDEFTTDHWASVQREPRAFSV